MQIELVFPHTIERHWKIVTDSLCNVQWTPRNLITAIDKIRTSSCKEVKEMPSFSRFSGLLKLFGDPYYVAGDSTLFWGNEYFSYQSIDSKISGWFFAHTVPFIVKLVLEMSETFASGIPLLNTADEPVQEVRLSKYQCVSLLACSFVCGYHHTCVPSKKGLNFDGIYIPLNKNLQGNQNVAKLCMLMNYFERCRLEMYSTSPDVIIKRLHNLNQSTRHDWLKNTNVLTGFEVKTSGSIDDAGPDALHADFANRWIGGGVLRKGAVQEEIMFCICPELLVTIHICGVMTDAEAILITGAEQFSVHSGYSRTLKYVCNFEDEEGTVSRVAMDASRFTGDKTSVRQYSEVCILRELNKAFVAFNHDYPQPGAPIATGNWGCGAFAGHVQLKAILQWLAASACSRTVKYYTFQDPKCQGLDEITAFLFYANLTVSQVFEAVMDFAGQVEPRDTPRDHLFGFLKETFEE